MDHNGQKFRRRDKINVSKVRNNFRDNHGALSRNGRSLRRTGRQNRGVVKWR